MGHIRLYVATSLDGRVADGEGGVGWLDDFDTPEHSASYTAFTKNIETIVMGRTTFDQVLTFGTWPYAGMRTLVVTSRPIKQPPPDTGRPPDTDTVGLEQFDRVIEELRARDRDT